MNTPQGYTVIELNERVSGVKPDLFTRFKWRADLRCRRRNARRPINTYRYEVCDWLDGRWAVVIMQNQLVPTGLTWICHVCGKERPDEKISVFSSIGYSHGISIKQNVRHCNDSRVCIESAKTIDFMNYEER